MPRARRFPLAAAIVIALAGGLAVGIAAGVGTLRKEARATAAATLAVTPVQAADRTADAQLADALTASLHDELRSRGGNGGSVRVVAWLPSMSYDRAAHVVRDGTRPVAIDYVLEGGVETGPTGARATFQVIATATGSVSWTRSYALGAGEGAPSGETLEHVAREVAALSRQHVTTEAARPR